MVLSPLTVSPLSSLERNNIIFKWELFWKWRLYLKLDENKFYWHVLSIQSSQCSKSKHITGTLWFQECWQNRGNAFSYQCDVSAPQWHIYQVGLELSSPGCQGLWPSGSQNASSSWPKTAFFLNAAKKFYHIPPWSDHVDS